MIIYKVRSLLGLDFKPSRYYIYYKIIWDNNLAKTILPHGNIMNMIILILIDYTIII